jgi:hypothetical protein
MVRVRRQPASPSPSPLALPSIMYTPEPAGPQRYTPNLSPSETTLRTSTPDVAQSSCDSSDFALERSSSQATDHRYWCHPSSRCRHFLFLVCYATVTDMCLLNHSWGETRYHWVFILNRDVVGSEICCVWGMNVRKKY